MLQRRGELPSHPRMRPTVWPFLAGGRATVGTAAWGCRALPTGQVRAGAVPMAVPSPPSLPGWVWEPPLQCCPGPRSPSLQLLVSAPHAPAQLAPPKPCQEPGLIPPSLRAAQLLQMEGRGPNEALRPHARRLHPQQLRKAAQHSKPAVTRTTAHENGQGWGWGMESAVSLQGLRTGTVRPHLGLSQLAWSFHLIYLVYKSI